MPGLTPAVCVRFIKSRVGSENVHLNKFPGGVKLLVWEPHLEKHWSIIIKEEIKRGTYSSIPGSAVTLQLGDLEGGSAFSHL